MFRAAARAVGVRPAPAASEIRRSSFAWNLVPVRVSSNRVGAEPRNSLDPVNQPMTSATTWTGAELARHTPADPRPTLARLATLRPGVKFRIDVAGGSWPHGQTVRYPGPVASVAVRLTDTDAAPVATAAAIG